MVTEDTLFESLAVIRRGELKSGDLLVLCHPGCMSSAGYHRLIDACQRVIGAGVKVIVLEEGVSVGAILSKGA